MVSRVFVVLSLIVGAIAVGSISGGSAGAQTCHVWNGVGSLQATVDAHTCVQLPAGTYQINSPLYVTGGHTLKGDPSVSRGSIILKASSSWTGGGTQAVVNEKGGASQPFTVQHFLIDANHVSSGGIGARYFNAQDMVIQNAECWGVAANGHGVTVNGSNIRWNGAGSSCDAPPGAGIYSAKPIGAGPQSYAPQITNNQIRFNTGPGLDIAGVWHGELSGNLITSNSHWAGVALFGSHWHISDNTIHHPAVTSPHYHSECHGGPNGTRSAAIMVCQRNDHLNDISVGNIIANNDVVGWYGILLVGNDQVQPYWAPRENILSNNDAFGSVHGFADDFTPGQWFNDRNHWLQGGATYF